MMRDFLQQLYRFTGIIGAISLLAGYTPSVESAPTTEKLEAPSPTTGLPRQRKVFRQVGNQQRPSVISSDFNGDGRMDFEQTYDESGLWVRQEKSDLDGNGAWDVTSFYQWNQARKSAVLSEEHFDTNYDGRTDLWKIYTKRGSLKERRLDRRLDGSPDYWEFYSNNEVVRIQQDEDGDGEPDKIPPPRIKR